MKNNHPLKLGFIGLGLMGKPMCRNLIQAGFDMFVTTRSPQPRQELAEAGAKVLETPSQVAAVADTIIIMVADTAAVESVLWGKHGAIDELRDDCLVIDMGTTSVIQTRRFAERISENGGLYVDAPVSGGTIGAESGSLTIMAGGSEEAFERALPILGILGDRITHVGASGAGQVAKAANQVIVGLNIGAAAEALALAKASGVDPAKVREALKGGFADSRILEVHGKRMVDGDYSLGARCTTQRKDMHQAIELGATLGLEMPATSLSRELYDQLIDKGGADLDHSALFTLLDIT
ncbi:MAG: NAD(P)-dependent oxidoreductase [Desulfofustis sp.]|nr:NAD(P)-dependent oxidoreductase [Desulfofustis sp.]